MSSKVMRSFALALVCAVVIGVAATAATARTESIPTAVTGSTAPIASGLFDTLFNSPQKSTAFAMTAATGATYARVTVSWRGIAPTNLPSSNWTLADQANPDSPYYKWSGLDATVSAAVANGVTPILQIVLTPKWAYHVQPGTVSGGQPDVAMLGAFAKAVARRYDGSGPAPAVHAFSVWNEPNFNRNISPQDPVYYRYMVNAVADSVHSVDSSNLALAGELAPYKHAKTKTDPNSVIPPMTWMQQMLCVSATTPAHLTCPDHSSRFDVWTHHPYSDKGPFGHASVAGGVELGDLPKMNTLLKTAISLGAIQSAETPKFWVTELGWSTNPPNKHGAPIKLVTRWVSESFWQMWKSGVTLGTWYLLQDEPTSFSPFQSGMYLNSADVSTAVAKSTLVPFTFPFVAYRKSTGKVMLWGREPGTSQVVSIQRKVNGVWKTLGTITANSNGIFSATLQLHALSTWQLRASTGSASSATFSLTVPLNENMNVVPFPNN